MNKQKYENVLSRPANTNAAPVNAAGQTALSDLEYSYVD